MPALLLSIVRYVVIMGVQLGVWQLVDKYVMGAVDKFAIESSVRAGVDREYAEKIINNGIIQALEDLGINVAIAKSKIPVEAAKKLGLEKNGWKKVPLEKGVPWSGPVIIGKDMRVPGRIISTASPAGEQAAKAFGISWEAVKNIGKVVGGVLSVTFLGVIAINNAIDFGNWQTGAYSDTFQKLYAKISFGLLKPNEDYRQTKTVSPEVFDKVYNTYVEAGIGGINDPFKNATVLFSRDTLIDLLDKVGADLLLAKGSASVKDVLATSQLLMVYKVKEPETTKTAAGARVLYSDLVNVGGTIYNKKGATPNTTADGGYPRPAALAADLGVATNAIQWNRISSSGAPPQGYASAPSQQTPTTPAPAIKVITGVIQQGVLGQQVDFQANEDDLIKNEGELEQAARVNLASYLTTVPGHLAYELKLSSSVVDADGMKRYADRQSIITGYYADGTPKTKIIINRFAVCSIYFVDRHNIRRHLDDIILGPTDASTLTLSAGALDSLSADISNSLTTNNITEIQTIQTDQPVSVQAPPALQPASLAQQYEDAAHKFQAWIDQHRGTPGVVEIPAGLMEAYGGGPSSDYVMYNGELWTKKNLELSQALANDPNMKNIGTPEAPLYVPKDQPTGMQMLQMPGLPLKTDAKTAPQATISGSTPPPGGLYQVEFADNGFGWEIVYYPPGKTPDPKKRYPTAPLPSAVYPKYWNSPVQVI